MGHTHELGDGHDHGEGLGSTTLDRRTLLRGSALAAGLALLPGSALARPLDTTTGTARQSRLRRRQLLAHADLHNHTQFSDAVGDPTLAHTSMRDAGLDIAALTDHTVANIALASTAAGAGGLCGPVPSPPFGQRDSCSRTLGMSLADFERTSELADAADAPGTFTALRGFEWSSPYLGHVNVWFTEAVTDPLATGGLTAEGLASVGLPLEALPTLLGPLIGLPGGKELIEQIADSMPQGMTGFYDWLLRGAGGPGGGGAGGIAGFNHPNREPETFDAFKFDVRVRRQMVSMEIMNRREDYLFKNLDEGLPSPLVTCLDAGWYVGLTGVTDEHGDDWGTPEGKGRTGLYLGSLDRGGVFDAMRNRRMFATRERGLRLDVGADRATYMGQVVPGRAPRLEVEVDLDWGPEHAGTPVQLQFLVSGDEVPDVTHVEDVVVPDPRERRPLRVSVPVDRRSTSWVVLRVSDPSRPNETPGPAGHPCNDRALAYASPLYLQGARPRRSGGPRPAAVARDAERGRQLLLGPHG